ncbi:MAG: cell division protein ZapA [Ferruginibacter sp.]
MAEELIPINILIADRTYRIRTSPKDEEVVRKTLKVINDKIIEFKTQFSGKDMQDYVSMVVIWYATQAASEDKSGALPAEILENLIKMETQLDKALSSAL